MSLCSLVEHFAAVASVFSGEGWPLPEVPHKTRYPGDILDVEAAQSLVQVRLY
jgi:hypothetical protein